MKRLAIIRMKSLYIARGASMTEPIVALKLACTMSGQFLLKDGPV